MMASASGEIYWKKKGEFGLVLEKMTDKLYYTCFIKHLQA